VSKTFGEWYQKTNKTEDTHKLNVLAFKIIILHYTRLATFIKLLETVSKGLFRNRSQNSCHTFCDRFLKRHLLTVSRIFMNVVNRVLWRMVIILKTNKFNLFVSSVLFVFWYHSPNVLDTPHICNISRLRVNCFVLQICTILDIFCPTQEPLLNYWWYLLNGRRSFSRIWQFVSWPINVPLSTNPAVSLLCSEPAKWIQSTISDALSFGSIIVLPQYPKQI
jgi:hypothetical protein